MKLLIAAIVGYLLGSISFGIIITKRIKGIDIRNYGSGNSGMTNVLRTVGKGPGALVLIGDVLKGVLSVLIGLYLGGEMGGVIAGIAAFVGHGFPLFFGFRGGKGVATGLGVMLVLVPESSVIALLLFAIVVLLSRYVSLGSIIAAVSVPISMIVFDKSMTLVVFGILSAAFVVYAHRSNIKRIYKGTENRLGGSKR